MVIERPRPPPGPIPVFGKRGRRQAETSYRQSLDGRAIAVAQCAKHSLVHLNEVRRGKAPASRGAISIEIANDPVDRFDHELGGGAWTGAGGTTVEVEPDDVD